MKINNKLIAVIVTLALAIGLLIPSTFSWYNHSDTQTGRAMQYERSNLPVSAGTLSMETKKYRTESNKLYYDDKGNKEYTGSALTTDSVASGSTQYYGTTITNTGAAPAYVNLYLKDFSNNPNNVIGTLQPSLTHKGISSSVHLKNKNKIRVYFQVRTANNWSTSGAKTYLVCKTQAGATVVTEITNNTTSTQPASPNNKATLYGDLSDNTAEFYFATDAKSSGINTGTGAVTAPWYRTKAITNIHAETGYYLTGVSDDTTWNAQYATFNIPGGVSVMSYFDKATMSSGQHAYVTLKKGTNYTGETATYAVQSGGASVNANTGYVTANGNAAVIRTTVTGSLGDSTFVDTDITNPGTINAAVSLNVEVPAQKTETVDGQSVTTPGKAEIVWYIKNGSSAECNFSAVYYTK